MATRVGRAVAILQNDGVFELASRVRDWSAERTTVWLRRPRMELQKIRLKLEYGAAAPHPLKVITVDPAEITHMLEPNFFYRKGRKYGTFVVGGEWDKRTYDERTGYGLMPFEDYYLCRSTIERFEEGLDWEETSGYSEEKVEEHGVEWYLCIDEIYENIQETGYRRQRELDSGMEENYDDYYVPPEYDEIRVNIARDGEIIFDDGRHRFAAVKASDVDQIPVRVFVRHEEWQDLRVEVANARSLDELSDRARRSLDHPDMQDVVGHLRA